MLLALLLLLQISFCRKHFVRFCIVHLNVVLVLCVCGVSLHGLVDASRLYISVLVSDILDKHYSCG